MPSVLVIEDNVDLRLMLQGTLAAAGYEVRIAEDGKQAAALYQNNAPDVVITDIYMPNRDGLEVIMELRANFPGTKIIAISGQVTHKNMLPVAKTLGRSGNLCLGVPRVPISRESADSRNSCPEHCAVLRQYKNAG